MVDQKKIDFMNALVDFDSITKEYDEYIKNNNIQEALLSFKKMATTAKEGQQFQKLYIRLISGMISGSFFYGIDKKAKDGIRKICRALGFNLGLRINEKENPQEKIIKMFEIFQGQSRNDIKLGDFLNIQNNGEDFIKFLTFSGGRLGDNKNIMELSKDSNLPDDQKNLLIEYMSPEKKENPKIIDNKSEDIVNILTSNK